MDARLPLNPNLGFYRKHAKDLKRAVVARDQAAAARLAQHHPRFRGRSVAEVHEISLGDAQFVIAREHGYSTWAEFKGAVEQAATGPRASPIDGLMSAIRIGDADLVRKALAVDRSLARQRDSKGVLPLVEACDRGALAIVELLLRAGADPHDGDPLLAAAHAGPHKSGPAVQVIELLLRHGAPDDIFTHATLGQIDALRSELPGVDLEARGPANSTALFLAAWNGQVEAVRVLLEAGAEPNPVCRDGQSAWQVVFLHIWSRPHRMIAGLFLEHGVECTFEEACVLSHLPTVKRLLAKNPAIKDAPAANGKTPLDIALLNADRELAAVLLEAGAADPKGQGRALVDAEPHAGKNFSRAVYLNCSFENANFHDATLANAIFSDVNLSGARLDNVNLSGVRVDNARIKGLTIYGIDVEPLLVQELERRGRGKERGR